MERRAFGIDLRVARAEGRGPLISGYAAVFDVESVDLGGFTERIARGAFASSIAKDVRALWGHDTLHVLGRSTAGTLRMREDDKGLHVEIDPPDTQVGRDVVTLIERRDVTGMSFGFRTLNDNWAKVAGRWLRTLLDVELLDVSPVTFPAYPATEVSIRSGDAADALARLAEAKAKDEARLRRLALYEKG